MWYFTIIIHMVKKEKTAILAAYNINLIYFKYKQHFKLIGKRIFYQQYSLSRHQ